MFRCRWQFDDGSEGFYLAEQVCHHPPYLRLLLCLPTAPSRHQWTSGTEVGKIPARENSVFLLLLFFFFFFFSSSPLLTFFPAHLPCCQFLISQKFYGNSVASLLEGSFRIILTDRPGEEYVVTFPNMYARGILIGTMVYEVSDPCKVTCAKHGFSAEIEFKSKVWKALFIIIIIFLGLQLTQFYLSWRYCRDTLLGPTMPSPARSRGVRMCCTRSAASGRTRCTFTPTSRRSRRCCLMPRMPRLSKRLFPRSLIRHNSSQES